VQALNYKFMTDPIPAAISLSYFSITSLTACNLRFVSGSAFVAIAMANRAVLLGLWQPDVRAVLWSRHTELAVIGLQYQTHWQPLKQNTIVGTFADMLFAVFVRQLRHC
jgi:hypothetical protein